MPRCGSARARALLGFPAMQMRRALTVVGVAFALAGCGHGRTGHEVVDRARVYLDKLELCTDAACARAYRDEIGALARAQPAALRDTETGDELARIELRAARWIVKVGG